MTQRIAWPPTLTTTGRLVTVEQDSDDDIAQCIRLVLLHRPGDRPDLPEMGVDELTFGEQPLPMDAIQEVLARHEPRASILAHSSPDVHDQAIAEVRVEWERQTTQDTEAL